MINRWEKNKIFHPYYKIYSQNTLKKSLGYSKPCYEIEYDMNFGQPLSHITVYVDG